MTHPGNDNTYIPALSQSHTPVTLAYIRVHGVVVAKSDDGATGLVEYRDGLILGYVGVTLNADGTIAGFMRRAINRCVRITPTGPTNGNVENE